MEQRTRIFANLKCLHANIKLTLFQFQWEFVMMVSFYSKRVCDSKINKRYVVFFSLWDLDYWVSYVEHNLFNLSYGFRIF